MSRALEEIFDISSVTNSQEVLDSQADGPRVYTEFIAKPEAPKPKVEIAKENENVENDGNKEEEA